MHMVWVGFEPTTTEFCWDALTDWAIRSWVQLALTTNFVQLLKNHLLFSVQNWFGLLSSSVTTFILILIFHRQSRGCNGMIWYIWYEWDLNPRPLTSVQMLSPTELLGNEFNSHSEPTLYSYSNFIFCSVFKTHFGYFLCQSLSLFKSQFCTGNHMSVAGWSDTYGMSGFEPKTTEFLSDALTDWAIRPWFQLTREQFQHWLHNIWGTDANIERNQ